jgi:hypothetical protein
MIKAAPNIAAPRLKDHRGSTKTITPRSRQESTNTNMRQPQMAGPRPSPTRACARAIADRLTDGGTIIEIGPHSDRLAQTRSRHEAQQAQDGAKSDRHGNQKSVDSGAHQTVKPGPGWPWGGPEGGRGVPGRRRLAKDHLHRWGLHVITYRATGTSTRSSRCSPTRRPIGTKLCRRPRPTGWRVWSWTRRSSPLIAVTRKPRA